METIYLITTLAATAGNDTVIAPSGISAAQYLSAIIGIGLPLIVAAVTQHVTSPATKSVLLLGLSAVTSVLTEWLTAMNNSAAFNWQQSLFGAILTFIVGVGTYAGLWKPTGVDDRLKRLGSSGGGERGAASALYIAGVVVFVLGALGLLLIALGEALLPLIWCIILILVGVVLIFLGARRPGARI